MSTAQTPTFTFTKLVVDDVDAMANDYCSAFGLHLGSRDKIEDGVAGESIDEVLLSSRTGEINLGR